MKTFSHPGRARRFRGDDEMNKFLVQRVVQNEFEELMNESLDDIFSVLMDYSGTTSDNFPGENPRIIERIRSSCPKETEAFLEEKERDNVQKLFSLFVALGDAMKPFQGVNRRASTGP